MLYTACLVCSTSYQVSKFDLNRFSKIISYKNQLKGINGFLVYSQGNIFKILEGEKEVVLNRIESLKKNALFSNLIIVFAQPLQNVKNHNPQFLTVHHTSKSLCVDDLTSILITSTPTLINVIREILKAFNYRIKEKEIQSFLTE
jgi:hypothetical protein